MTPRFVDTSVWLAYANTADADHRRVAAALEKPGRLVTSSYIMDEVVTLLQRRRGHADAATIGRRLLSGEAADLIHVEAKDEAAALALFEARPDKDYSFTDCTSFILMRRLGIHAAVALDDDFRQEGFGVAP